MSKSKFTPVEQDLIEGLEAAIKHSKGEIKLRENVREIPDPPPQYTRTKIKKLREDLGYSQPAFAAVLNVKTITIRSWEQGVRHPSDASNRLLQIFEIGGQEVVQKLRRSMTR